MPVASAENSKSRGAWAVATFFGVGRMYPGPGTWASAITVALWWVAAQFINPNWRMVTLIAAAIAVTVGGIHPSTIVARESATEDPGFVVIDEVAGQLIALIGTPLSWNYLLAS